MLLHFMILIIWIGILRLVFGDVMPCSLVDVYQRFGEPAASILRLECYSSSIFRFRFCTGILFLAITFILTVKGGGGRSIQSPCWKMSGLVWPGCEADYSPYSSEVKNAVAITQLHHVSSWLLEHRYNFTYTQVGVLLRKLKRTELPNLITLRCICTSYCC